MRVFVSSNLNILDNKQAADLIESKFDYLIVSLDGNSQESYEKYRIGGDFNKVIENIRLLIDTKNEKKSLYSRLVIQPVIFRHNEGEVPKFKALADHLGVNISIRQGNLGGKGQSPPVTKDIPLAKKWLSQTMHTTRSTMTIYCEQWIRICQTQLWMAGDYRKAGIHIPRPSIFNIK